MYQKLKSLFQIFLNPKQNTDRVPSVSTDEAPPKASPTPEPKPDLTEWEGFVMAAIQFKLDRWDKGEAGRVTYEAIRTISTDLGGPFTSCRKIAEAFGTLEEKGFIERHRQAPTRITTKVLRSVDVNDHLDLPSHSELLHESAAE